LFVKIPIFVFKEVFNREFLTHCLSENELISNHVYILGMLLSR